MVVGARRMVRETTACQTVRSLFPPFKKYQKLNWSLQGFESGKRSAETPDGETGRAKRTKSEEET